MTFNFINIHRFSPYSYETRRQNWIKNDTDGGTRLVTMKKERTTYCNVDRIKTTKLTSVFITNTLISALIFNSHLFFQFLSRASSINRLCKLNTWISIQALNPSCCPQIRQLQTWHNSRQTWDRENAQSLTFD